MHGFSWRTYVSWRYLVRLLVLVGGLFFYSLGTICLYRSNFGLGPWDVLHQGISFHTPLSFGQAVIVVGALLILGCLSLKVYPGVGTICNMILIGVFEDMLLHIGGLQSIGQAFWIWRLLLNIAGVIIIGLGTALYIAPRLGAGPRDGLMLRLHELTKLRVSVVRGSIEVTVCILGFLLGGSVGIGTLIFAFGVGPAVEASFSLCKRIHLTEWLVPSTVVEPAAELAAEVDETQPSL
ncbi:YczE/YyaS/YitT family protein [Dictyobacter arantiisoli]|uniref:Membrane protein n=1 Tax=Dictyobacter arantiisoli TaxID=2014874 RepID=A0A5A5TI21_9CHLR|nr:hypothetical protein [Dictyobacter arantiisoli]GCF11037.1 membrane protein [Dictyobacter arantiisoli]